MMPELLNKRKMLDDDDERTRSGSSGSSSRSWTVDDGTDRMRSSLVDSMIGFELAGE